MDDIGRQAQRLSLLLEPLAAMMVKKIRPIDDELSTNAAYKAYGRAWIEDQRRRGNLSPVAKGQRLVWSRSEIEALRAVEMQHPKVVTRQTRNIK